MRIKKNVSTTVEGYREAKDKSKTQKAIKDFIDTDWSKDDDSVGKAVNLLKGIAFSKDKKAKEFIKDLDKLSNTMDAKKYVSESKKKESSLSESGTYSFVISKSDERLADDLIMQVEAVVEKVEFAGNVKYTFSDYDNYKSVLDDLIYKDAFLIEYYMDGQKIVSESKKKESSLSESGTYPSPMYYDTIIIKKGAEKFIINKYGYDSTDLIPTGEYYFTYSNHRNSFNLESVKNERSFYILSEEAFQELYKARLLKGGRLNSEGEYLNVEEDTRIPETDIILEKGDRITLVKTPMKERATVNPDMYSVAYEYLDSMKKKGTSPDSISSSVMSNIMTKYEEIHGSLHYDKEAYKDFSASFRKAFKDVFGREGFNAFRQANKKIR